MNLMIVIVLIIAVLLRLVPALYFNEPYSLDSWPLIRDSEVIMSNPNVKIWNDSLLDGYNNRWPGTILATLLYSIITESSIIDTYKFFGPLVSSLTTLVIMYVLLRRIFKYSVVSILALTYFALALPLLVFTSATIKEVYAYPMFYSIALLTLIMIYRRSINTSAIAIIALMGVALSITHHLASIMLIGILGSIIMVYSLLSLLGRLERSNSEVKYHYLIIPLTILSAVFTVYYFVYGGKGFKMPLNINDVITYLIYATTIYLTYSLMKLIPSKTKKLMIILILMITTITLLAVPRKSIIPGIGSINDLSIILYVLPVFLPLTLIPKLSSVDSYATPLVTGSYLLLATNLAYIILAKPELSGAFHRVANYLIVANTLLIAHLLSYRSSKVKSYILTILFITTACSIVGALNIIHGGDGVTYYWTFRPGEAAAFNTVDKLVSESVTVLGDAKVAYFYSILRNVDSGTFLKFVQRGNTNVIRGKLVLLYSDNYRWGYVVSLNSIDIKPYRQLILKLDRVIDFSYVNGLMGGE